MAEGDATRWAALAALARDDVAVLGRLAKWARLDLRLSVTGLLMTAVAVPMTTAAVLNPWMQWAGQAGYDEMIPGDPTPHRVRWPGTFVSTLSVPDAVLGQSVTSSWTSASSRDHLLAHAIAAGGWLLVAISAVLVVAAVVGACRRYPVWQAIPERVRVSRCVTGVVVALLAIPAALLIALDVLLERGDVTASVPDAHFTRLLPLGPSLLVGAVLLQVVSRTPDLGARRPVVGSAREAVQVYRRLAADDPDRWLPLLAAAASSVAVGVAESGHSERVDGVWRSAEAGLPDTCTAPLRLLRSGWEWVATPGFHAERRYLETHPILLAPGSETYLRHVLRHQQSLEAARYLAVLDTARRTDVATAYQDLATDAGHR